MSEQYELDFEAPKESVTGTDYESMSTRNLEILYKESVGVTARFIADEKAYKKHLILAIQNPEVERQRLKVLDSEDDKNELREQYRKKYRVRP